MLRSTLGRIGQTVGASGHWLRCVNELPLRTIVVSDSYSLSLSLCLLRAIYVRRESVGVWTRKVSAAAGGLEINEVGPEVQQATSFLSWQAERKLLHSVPLLSRRCVHIYTSTTHISFTRLVRRLMYYLLASPGALLRQVVSTECMDL